MTALHARAHEVRAMLAQGEFVIVRPLKPQPSSVDDNGRWYRMPSGGESLNCYLLPYDAGDAVVVKEAHAIDGIRVLYAATDDINELRKVRSSAAMPRWASRLTLTVTCVQVKRLQDVTEEEARLAGVKEFHWHFQNADHGNPWVVLARSKVHHCNIAKVNSEEAA